MRLRGNFRGSALIIAVMLSLIVIFLMTVGSRLIVTSSTETKTQQKVLAEADNIARAGLVDAIAWFKRQSMQPVRSGYPPTLYAYADAAFYPRYSTDTTKSSTIDESVGLVKEFQISDDGLKWARYEVRRQTVDPAAGAYDSHAVHDITSQRIDAKNDGEGLAWYIESIGYVYKKVSAGAAFNVSPNSVLSKVRASTEVRRLSLSLPVEAALLTSAGGSGNTYKVKIYKNGRVIGGNNIGCGYVSGNSPKIYTGGQLTGNPSSKSGISAPTVSYVLGVSATELKLLCDYTVSDTSQLPSDLPDMTLIYVDGNAVFSSTRTLRSSGILFVNGNLTISANSNSLYSGLIYATGTVTIDEPALISGSVVAYGGATISNSSASDVAEIDYDATILSSVRQQLCQYRENKSTLHVFIGVPGLEN